MKNARFLNLLESILEQKQRSFLSNLMERKSGRKRLKEDTYDGLEEDGDETVLDGLDGADFAEEAVSLPAAARKADKPDPAQIDISHLEEDDYEVDDDQVEEEDDAQLDLDNLLTGERDGDDVVVSEDDEFNDGFVEEDDEFVDDFVEEDGEDDPLDSFFEDFDVAADLETPVDDGLLESRKRRIRKEARRSQNRRTSLRR